MTVLPWPAAATSRRPRSTRKMIVDPLPQPILHSLVSGIPGPRDETDVQKSARYDAQLAEVLSYQPRNSAEAMLATHCVLYRLLAEDAQRDAARPGQTEAQEKKRKRMAKQMDKMLADMRHALARRQARPLGKMDPALAVSLGMEQFLIPDPDDPDQAEPAFSATIVPLHPAPKTLQ
jgi:hypothetical protein